MNLYVSNLGDDITSESLRAIFATHGEVGAYKIIRHQAPAPSRGFGFINMPNDVEAQRAIEKINGMVVNGCLISVMEAQPGHGPKGSMVDGRKTV